MIRPKGYFGLISTNSISQGVAREGGLEVILQRGGVIIFAVPSQRWPGRAAVEVSLIAVYRGSWNKPVFLNHTQVSFVSSFLDEAVDDKTPHKLAENEGKCFMGSTVVGPGFVLSKSEAEKLLKNGEHSRVVFPYLNGSDLNTEPDQKASRWIISFGEMPLKRLDWKSWTHLSDREQADSLKEGFVGPDYKGPVAADFPRVLEMVESRVRPYREQQNYSERSVLKWWQFYRPTVDLYQAVQNLDRVLVTAQVSKTTAFDFVNTKQVFDAKLIIFAFDDFATFSVLQSNFHVNWAWKYCTTMKADLSYGPERLFVTYPFPKDLKSDSLVGIGKRYHECRQHLMLKLQLGLTKTYNLFHKPKLSVDIVAKESKRPSSVAEAGLNDIMQLRNLHIEMDEAVLAAYGWHQSGASGPAIDLRHNFYEVDYLPESDRVRYTIHPDARKDLLKRLLQLNHERAVAQDTRVALKKTARAVASVRRQNEDQLDLPTRESE